jgi:hypothetical protein
LFLKPVPLGYDRIPQLSSFRAFESSRDRHEASETPDPNGEEPKQSPAFDTFYKVYKK